MIYQALWIFGILTVLTIVLLAIPRKGPKPKANYPAVSIVFLVMSFLAFAGTIIGIRTCSGDFCGIGDFFYGSGITLGLSLIAFIAAILSKLPEIQ